MEHIRIHIFQTAWNRMRPAALDRRWRVAPALLAWFIICAALAGNAAQTPVDFNRDIRPILSENCFKCHGPDEGARKAKLRLDTRTEALKPAESGKAAIIPGSSDQSELVQRLNQKDLAARMPPPKSGKHLTPRQIEILGRWVQEGAPYAVHWAYHKPTRPPVPEVKDRQWPQNDLDRFILARLEKEKLEPSPKAPPRILIRRVSLDLTGLPPTPETVEGFAGNPTPEAYARIVDELLASPAFGEHWARMWLDLARYADSAGYADDPPRTIWGYRDYVIRSFNKNKPFDQFTVEQIAGDLLPDPDEEKISGSAFHRNTMTNNEGGTDDEEFRNAAVVDRVNTTMAVWMATSMACAQCHSHKYDPITQKDYFQMFAILNNTEDADRQDESPVTQLYSDAEKSERCRLQGQIAETQKFLDGTASTVPGNLRAWESGVPLELAWDLGVSPRPLSPEAESFQFLGTPPEFFDAVLTPSESRTGQQDRLIRAAEEAALRQRLQNLQSELAGQKPNPLPIMRELPEGKRRVTTVQVRGNFRVQGETVGPGVPEAFHPLRQGMSPDRLGLANWLIDEENPLTARVLANRLWEQLFGTGIVRTTEEFGSQGEPPNYPELLDFLATQIVASHWDIKSFLKLLVTSSTYQQSSAVTADLRDKDPDNLLLARGPRFRMPAEVIRDQALFVSGLLSRKMYGPPIRPPQPSLGLSAAFGGALDWKTSEGEDRYRRGIYVEWRRTNPYASMATFDAPNREVCTLRRPRSNTPLQALVTLNDPVYVEAAQALASRIMLPSNTIQSRIQTGFKLCLCRPPTGAELERLASLYSDLRNKYAQDKSLAEKAAHQATQPIPDGTDEAEFAAWTALCNVLLNLDEMLMRP